MNDDKGKLVNVNVDLGNIGDYSKPANALINRLSEHLGGFLEPYRRVKMAKADAKVAIIAAETRQTLTEIEERGLKRLVTEEGRKQENIEQISYKALPHIKDSAAPEKLESDWIADFFDKAKMISDSQMQEIWAKLLAQESNNPKSISKRAVAALATFDKSDAELFTRFCNNVWMVNGLTPMVFKGSEGTGYSSGLIFTQLKHLDALGLISFESVSDYSIRNFPNGREIHYYGRGLKIEHTDGNVDLQLGCAILTEVGKQIAQICGSKPNQGSYIEAVEHIYNCTEMVFA
jgi:Protein of unknown function (DUF2806)